LAQQKREEARGSLRNALSDNHTARVVAAQRAEAAREGLSRRLLGADGEEEEEGEEEGRRGGVSEATREHPSFTPFER